MISAISRAKCQTAGIVDMTGATVVEYRYDTWGKPAATEGSMAGTLGKDNPFRYRGYVWDEETGLYYLESRYYSSEWMRFVNADTNLGDVSHLLSHNLSTYVHNNPVMLTDPTGQSPWYKIGEDYRYRIDDGPNSRHIHIKGPDGKQWKQKSTGEPYEPNHPNTNKGDPPSWIRKLLKKAKDDNDNDKRGGGGASGPGWDWDGNKKHYEDTQANESKKAIETGATLVAGGGFLYLLYRAVRLVPSLFPPLWPTLTVNIALP